jgi:metal-dependent amidase/aminoacylase/carboxypeptidase family protein
MTELENLKIKLFEIVECIGALETKPNEDTIVFTKKQLISYSKSLIDEAIQNITDNIKRNVNIETIDEAIELEIRYNREIEVCIDERALQNDIISIIEDSIGEGGIEYHLEQFLIDSKQK